MNPTILITGGAGYIGSHTSYLMAQNGYNVIILDKLIHGQTFNHKWAKLNRSGWKQYIYGLVSAEISTTTRFSELTVATLIFSFSLILLS